MEWTFTPTMYDGLGGKINGLDVKYGWHSRKVNETTCIVCVLKFWIYVTIFEKEVFKKTEMYGKNIEINSDNICLSDPISKTILDNYCFNHTTTGSSN